MVAKVETKVEDNLVGDMLVEQDYSGYKDFGGVKFPTKIVQTRAGLPWTDLTVSDVKANAPAPPPPAAAAGRGGAGRGGAAPEGRGGAQADGRGGAGRGAAPEGRGAAAGGGGRGGAPAAPAVTAKK